LACDVSLKEGLKNNYYDIVFEYHVINMAVYLKYLSRQSS